MGLSIPDAISARGDENRIDVVPKDAASGVSGMLIRVGECDKGTISVKKMAEKYAGYLAWSG